MQTIFITGGSGFLGINLIRHLLKKGYAIINFDLLPFDYPEKDQVKTIIGDIRNKEALSKAMQGAGAIVHTAAALPLYSKEDIYSTDIDGTRNVLDSALENGIARVVHISSTAVYGIPDHHPLFETDQLIGVGPYGEAKIKAEQRCLDYRQKGLVTTIIRPKSFVGPERLGVFALFYDWAKDGHGFPMIGSGENRYQLLDVEDLCEAIELSLKADSEVANDIYNIGAEEFTTMKEDYQAVLDHAGFGKKITGLPEKPIIFTLRLLEMLHLSPLYKWVYETASKDSFVSIDKAKSKLNWKPRFSNKQALIRNYDWYIANIKTFDNQSGVTHRVPWKQGILGLAKWIF